MDKAVETGGTMSEETRATIDRLHTILRPYMLRRLKSEVETQLPGKHEHVIYCRLSKRQRFLYDEFMSRASTRESLISGGYLGVANCLMQLRKVCNHPDLFEVRPVRTSFAMGKSVASDFGPVAERVYKNLLMDDPESKVDLDVLNLRLSSYGSACSLASQTTLRLDGTDLLPDQPLARDPPIQDSRTLAGWQAYRDHQQGFSVGQRWRHIRYLNRLRCARRPTYGSELLSTLRRLSLDFRTLPDEEFIKHPLERESFQLLTTRHLVQSLSSRAEAMAPVIDRFAVITPNATTQDLAAISLPSLVPTEHPELMDVDFDTLHRATVKLQIAFPDASLLQYDCGKLQVLHDMLKELKAGGHRVIIFTQMTKMLDILELFLSYNGHRYFRLDGGTKIEDRQRITERFNSDERIFAFIASTRAGGVGIK
jgi:helicase SWR1